MATHFEVSDVDQDAINGATRFVVSDFDLNDYERSQVTPPVQHQGEPVNGKESKQFLTVHDQVEKNQLSVTSVVSGNLALYEEDIEKNPRIATFLNSLKPVDGTAPNVKSMKKKKKANLGTLMGVYLPTLQNILGVILFLRLPWIVGISGVGMAVLIVCLCCITTLLTSISLSAIATNGHVPAGGAYFMLSRNLGPEFGGAVGILFYLANTFATSLYTVGAIEILVTYIFPQVTLFPNITGNTERLNNDIRVFGTILLLLLTIIVFVGVKLVNWFATVCLIAVLVAVLSIYAGAFNPIPRVPLCEVNGAALEGRFNCDQDIVATVNNMTWLSEYLEDDCDMNDTIDITKICSEFNPRLKLSFNGTFFTLRRGVSPNLTDTDCEASDPSIGNWSVPPTCVFGVPGIATVQNIIENTPIEYLEEGEVSPGVKGVGVQVSAEITTSFLVLIGIFFPSVTGIMAGSNRSGDLKDAQKSIPIGTIAAVCTTSLIYLTCVLFFGGTISRLMLKDQFGYASGLTVSLLAWPTKYIILVGALLSTIGAGLQSLTGAPRLLQAIANDDLMFFLKLFKRTGLNGEPTFALVLTALLSEIGVLIASLDLVAPILTMFFLICYMFVNFACALQSILKAPNWRPRFRFYHWSTSLIGALLCIILMFLVSWYYALVALLLAGVIYKYIEYRGAEKEWGDGVTGLSLQAALYSLLKLEERPLHTKNWRPQLLLLCKLDDNLIPAHPKMLSFASQLKEGELAMAGVSGTGHRQCIFLLLVISHFSVVASTKTALHVAVVLSSSELERPDISDLNSWKQGDTLLPAAQLAANDVNNHSDVLDDYVIELIPILVPDSDPNHGLVELFKELLSESRNIIGVTGVFDNKFANLIIPLAGHIEVDLIQLVDPTALNLDSNMLYPNTFSLYPSLAVHVRAASFLFQKLRWTKVGLIYSSTDYDPLYLRAAESFVAFIKLIDIDISVELLDVCLNVNSTTNSTLDMLQQSSVSVFLVLLPQQESTKLMCTAQQFGMEYTWVVVDNSFLNLSDSWIASQYRCENASLSESLLVIRQSSQPNDLLYNELSFNLTVQNRAVVSDNIHSSILYDSVWALSLAVNASLGDLERRNISLQSFGHRMNGYSEAVKQQLHNLHFQGSERPVFAGEYPPGMKLDILQLQSGHLQQIGHFDSMAQSVTLNISISVLDIGRNNTYYDVFPPSLTAVVLVWMGFCFILTTVVLVVFILLRNEKEVKATSASLSVCMFVGCYLILCGALNHFISSASILTTQRDRLSTCNIDSYSVSIGVDLLLTTLLAKLLRIWRIFTLHGRTGKVWTDQSLLLFIGLVVLFKVVLLIIWTAVDIYQLQDVVTIVSIHGLNYNIKISQHCFSEYYSIWLVIAYGYSTAIGITLIAVSIITRKIKQENFKDTKKVSILISTLIYMALVCGSLWGVLRLTGNGVASKIVIGMAYCLISLLSEVFLFFPKILPPLLRKFHKTVVVHKKIVTGSSIRSRSTENSVLYSVN